MMPVHLIGADPAAYFSYLLTVSRNLAQELEAGLRLYDEKQFTELFYSGCRYFKTEEEAAAKGFQQLKRRLGNPLYGTLIYLLASDNYDRYNLANRLLVKTARYGKSYAQNRSDDDMARVQTLARAVSRERHRFLGITRFEELSSGALLAEINPTYRIAPLLGEHFRKRLGGRPFAISDCNRREALFFDGERFILGEVTGQLNRSNQEALFQDLWKTYHRHIAIEARQNKALQQQNLPQKFWPYLTELREESLLAEEQRQEGSFSD